MQIKIWRLLVFLGLASSFCAAESAIRTSELLHGIAPLVAQAYTSRVNITLERQPNESFQTLTRRAETVARAAAQRSFDNDILVTQASIVVTGESGGLSAPILRLEVSRENWKNHPDAQRWSTYYPSTQALLRIPNPVPTNTSGAGTNPSTGTTTNPTARPSTAPNATPGTTPGTTPANRSSQNSGLKPTTATGTSTTNPTGTANQRSNSTNTRSNTQNTQQRNSTTPANTTGTNNNQTGTSNSLGVQQTNTGQQTNTQSNPPSSTATYGEGLIRRTRELRDDINNRPPTDIPQE